MRFLNNAAEGWIDQSGIVDAVVDLHGVMVHLSSAVRANHLWSIHCLFPLRRDVLSVFENILANSRAMPR